MTFHSSEINFKNWTGQKNPEKRQDQMDLHITSVLEDRKVAALARTKSQF